VCDMPTSMNGFAHHCNPFIAAARSFNVVAIACRSEFGPMLFGSGTRSNAAPGAGSLSLKSDATAMPY
jgi:hypothetical protein